MSRVGGQSPDSYGLSLTVNVPTASATKKTITNQPLRWAAGAFNAINAIAGEVIQLVAKHPVEDALTPLGVWVAGGNSRVHVFTYTGTAPSLGAGIVADGTGGVKAALGSETGNTSRVLYVDTVRKYVEVLI
ncbi:hypothetical protein [Peribacillus frigoritolerans]|uniref:hypothetical protein n=1 Tax=Peribacillus frigoritolerans TaxID=450367 RepID=UPI00207A941E|nr:hypothetical protein [Peribacillus frigoritolerans]USK77827.1 hypothetical protein LIT31_26235 [Peribacillus frigoritolerans]USK77841.1 hypothetical protein LIT31_26975 [Peribacillus frigoritolerans]